MIAVPSSGPAHTITQDTKARPAHLKDENFNGNQITPQCCKGNRLVTVVCLAVNEFLRNNFQI